MHVCAARVMGSMQILICMWRTLQPRSLGSPAPSITERRLHVIDAGVGMRCCPRTQTRRIDVSLYIHRRARGARLPYYACVRVHAPFGKLSIRSIDEKGPCVCRICRVWPAHTHPTH